MFKLCILQYKTFIFFVSDNTLLVGAYTQSRVNLSIYHRHHLTCQNYLLSSTNQTGLKSKVMRFYLERHNLNLTRQVINMKRATKGDQLALIRYLCFKIITGHRWLRNTGGSHESLIGYMNWVYNLTTHTHVNLTRSEYEVHMLQCYTNESHSAYINRQPA
jgi:hypothetical protein